MDTIATLLIDDEPLARDGIRLALRPYREFKIIGECGNGREAITAIRKLRPRLVFLDVQMPDVDGFGVLRKLKQEEIPLIVFVTAFDKFAVDAFEASALDYVLKPINPDRFAHTIERIRQRCREQDLSATTRRLLSFLQDIPETQTSVDPIERFAIKTGERIHFVTATDIDWIEADDYYVKLHVARQTHLLRDTLAHLENQLDPRFFVRIHRSTIVNVSRIKELKQHFRGEYVVILQDGTRLKLSRSYRHALERILPER